jgi:hypothetical protein
VHRLAQLSVDDLVALSGAFRELGIAATSMEDAAQRLTEHLHRTLVLDDDDGRPACRLVRLYKTHRYGDLDAELQAFARAAHGAPVDEATRCLTLLGTSGDEPAWNERRRSDGHQAIPLVSEEVVAQSPMVASLISELGLAVAEVVAPEDGQTIDLHHRDYDIFFVPDAHGSPSVPAQAGFVEPYEVRSVVGCGGVLPSGDLFALIAFTGVDLDAATADLFRTVALSVKATLVRFTYDVFAEAASPA